MDPTPVDPAVVEAARLLAARAKDVEPAVTAQLQAMAQRHGAKLEGLGFRLKKSGRLLERVIALARITSLPPERAAGLVHDALRYTFVFDMDSYARGAWAILEDLRQAGCKVAHWRNCWNEPTAGGYRGINSAWLWLDGFRFEVQFHTPQSWQVKQVTHDIYERSRVETDPKRRLELDEEHRRHWIEIDPPEGALRIALAILDALAKAPEE